MMLKKIFALLLAFFAVSVPVRAGAEAWRDPSFDLLSLRKIFLLPVEADLKAGDASSVVPQSRQREELEGWAVSSLQTALKRNRPIVKAAGALLKDMDFTGYKDAAADVASPAPEARERFFQKAAELGYQAAVQVSLAQKFDTVHVPEKTWTHTVYKEIERRDRNGKIIETLRIPEERTEVTPAHDETYLSTQCLVRLYGIQTPNGDHKAAASRSIYREYQGGPVMKVVENIIAASVKELFEQETKK